MPKIVKLKEYNPPNLLGSFNANKITPASGDSVGIAEKFNYDAFSDLRLWIRFKPESPSELVKYNTSDTPAIIYEGTEDTSELAVINNKMHVARFDNQQNKNVKLTFPGGSGNTNILSFGDGSTQDLPFSVSFWFKKIPETNISDATDNFFWKGNTNSNLEFGGSYVPSNENIYFYLIAAGNASLVQGIIGDTAGALTDGQWHHVVFTYDGTGGMSANTGMNVYIDGAVLSKTANNVGTYTYMDNVSEILYIGANQDGNDEADGNMAEFAIWAKELSLEEIKAIYYWTYEPSVVKSGYLDNSYRIKLREKDNTPNCYPTHHRMGDIDRSGKRNIFFDDISLNFKKTIFDDFSKDVNSNVVDTNSWVVSNGVVIKNNENSDQELIDRCAVFQGVGTSIPGAGLKRFIRSKNKIINPVKFNFEVVRGNYNLGSNTLNLKYRSDPDDEFKLSLQISTDSNFLTPTTIVTASFKEGIYDFYNAIDDDPIKEPRGKKYSLTLKDFPNMDGSYYFRFVQDTYASNEANWAIRSIDVEYYDGQVNYPLLVDSNSDPVGIAIRKRSIASQNMMSNLSGSGRLVQGISDIIMPYAEKTENISAFNDENANEEKENIFFQGGTPTSVRPGLDFPTAGKTKFVIDLSPSEETTVGMTNPLAVTEVNASNDTSEKGSQLMVYWNNILKKWEKRGQPLRGFNSPTPTLANYATILTGACVGFSGVTLLGTASAGVGDDFSFFSKDQISLSNKQIDQYNFPYGEQYYATSSQLIKAKDLGITKPFLLEKLSLESQIKLESPGSNNHDLSYSYSHPNFLREDATKSKNSQMSRLKIITPTFFLLRQFNDNYTKTSFIQSGSGEKYSYTINLPTQSFLNEGDSSTVYVDKNREIITFAQNAFFVTGTTGFSNGTSSDVVTKLPDDFATAGLLYDNITTVNVSDMREDLSLTQSVIINSSVKNTSKYPLTYSTRFYEQSSAGITQLLFGKDSSSRNDASVKSSRAITNGFSATEPGELIIVPGEKSAVPKQFVTGPKSDSLLLSSPYLIQPEDELILGWQYPFPNQLSDFGKGVDPGTDSVAFNSMTLFGRSKLYLYGSQIVSNQEFHETTNQNLTTCAVYEHIIGNEKVIDQWQVAYRGELTGSIYSLGLVQGTSQFDDGSNPNIINNAYLSPSYVFINEANQRSVSFRISDFEKLAGTDNSGFSNAAKRTGLPTFSAFGGKTSLFNFLRQFYSSDSQTNSVLDSFYMFRPPPATNAVNLKDQFRIYVDSTKFKGDFYDDSTYGTKTGQMTGDVLKRAGNFAFGTNRERERLFQDHYPKYYFDTKRFGQYSNMIRQGLDGNMTFKPASGIFSEFSFGEITELSQPAVKARFVTIEVDELGVKSYPSRSVNSFMESFHFQSSNLNTAMTSSMPFIDDNEPKNRTYLSEETDVDTTS